VKRKLLIASVALLVLVLAGVAWLYHSITNRVEGQYFDSNGVRIHYTVEGEGEPVILVHGFAANADANWRVPGVTEKLAKEFKVIALDHRGHGLSDKPRDAAQYGEEMCRDIVRLMDHLKIEKAHVIGYSMGGYITLKLITMFPDRLLSAAPCAAGWEEAGGVGDKREAIASALETDGDFSALFKAISPPGKLPPRRGILSLNYMLSLTNDIKALAAAMRGMSGLVVTEEQLRANKVPTLTVIGSEDPLRTGVDRMNGVMANQEIVFVDGGDHITTLPRAEFINTLRAFIKKNSPSSAPASQQPEKSAA